MSSDLDPITELTLTLHEAMVVMHELKESLDAVRPQPHQERCDGRIRE